MFSADSRSCALLMRCLKAKLWPHDETALLALTSTAYSKTSDSVRRITGLVPSTRDAGGRRTREGIPEAQDSVAFAAWAGGKLATNQPSELNISCAFGERRDALRPVAQSLQHLAGQGVLSQSLDTLLASFVHLHVNRFTGLTSSRSKDA